MEKGSITGDLSKKAMIQSAHLGTWGLGDLGIHRGDLGSPRAAAVGSHHRQSTIRRFEKVSDSKGADFCFDAKISEMHSLLHQSGVGMSAYITLGRDVGRLALPAVLEGNAM